MSEFITPKYSPDPTASYNRFKGAVVKLKGVFGDGGFKEARVEAMWLLAKNYPIDWFENAATFFIKTSRSAPLPKDLEDFYIEIKENQNAVAAAPISIEDLRAAVWKSSDPEFAKFCLSVIESKLAGTITKEQYTEALRHIEYTAGMFQGTGVCKRCNQSGYLHKNDAKGYSYLYRCDCSAGRNKPGEIFWTSKLTGDKTGYKVPELMREI